MNNFKQQVLMTILSSGRVISSAEDFEAEFDTICECLGVADMTVPKGDHEHGNKIELAKSLANDIITEFEGFSGKAYKCPAGVWTVGFGTTKNVTKNSELTLEQANKYLAEEIDVIIKQILEAVKVELSPNQLAALISFVYNLGITNFINSTLRRVILSDESTPEEIREQFLRWVYAKGKKLAGLVSRRIAEADLWEGTIETNN